MPFVYLVRNQINGRRYIGICASTVRRRWRRHCTAAAANKPRNRNCPALHSAIRKYGEAAFVVTTLYEADSWKEACAVERGLIAQYGTFWPAGYNLTCGGDGVSGRKRTAAHREKMEAAVRGKKQTPEHVAKRFASRIPIDLSPEARRALADRQRQRWRDPAYRAAFIEGAQSRRDIAIANLGKARASNIGRSPSAETRAKMSAWQIGKVVSAETRQRISAARIAGNQRRRGIV